MIEFGEFKVDSHVWAEQFMIGAMEVKRRVRLDTSGNIIAHKDTIKKLNSGENVAVSLRRVGDTFFDPVAYRRLKLCAL